MNNSLYRELQIRMAENRTLGRGGAGRMVGLRKMSEWLAVNPWRVIIPGAAGISLVSWWVWGERLTLLVLRIFGGG